MPAFVLPLTTIINCPVKSEQLNFILASPINEVSDRGSHNRFGLTSGILLFDAEKLFWEL